MNIQNILKEYNAACEKHDCFLGDMVQEESDLDVLFFRSEYHGIGVQEIDGKNVYSAFDMDMDQEFHNILEGQEEKTFESLDALINKVNKYYFT